MKQLRPLLLGEEVALDGVEAVGRRAGRGSYLVVLNHSTAPAVVSGPGHDLLGDRRVEGGVLVPAGGFVVVREGPLAAGDAWDVVEAAAPAG